MTRLSIFDTIERDRGKEEDSPHGRDKSMEKTFRLKKGEALLLTDETQRRYFTGFESSFGAVLITAEGRSFYTDKRYLSAAKAELREKGWNVEEFVSYETIGRRAAAEGAKSALIDYSHTTMTEYAALKGMKLRFKDAKRRLESLFAVKDRREIACIARACDIAEKAFYKTLSFVKEGITEKELANALEANMLALGADKTSFDTIVAFGANSAVPHHKTGNDRLKRDMPVLVDFGCMADGYCSDCTRTFFFGEPSDEFVDVYAAVLEANLEAEKKIRTGTELAAADKIARDVLEKKGYKEAFTHTLGHGIGTRIHEYPTLGPKSAGKLKSGMVFSIEPGVYFDGKYGVRIEDTVVLKGGVKRLFKDEKNLILID